MRVHDLMTRNVATTTPDASLADAARLMWERDCGILPVVETPTGTLCGIITDRDICMGGMTQGRPLHEIPVRCSMVARVWRCAEDDEVRTVEDMMGRYRVRRMPVVDRDQRVIGIVAIDDLARAAVRPEHAEPDLKFQVGETLGRICTPHSEIEAVT